MNEQYKANISDKVEVNRQVKDGTGRWLVSGHAYERIKERFGYEGKQADRFIQHVMIEADMNTKRASDQTPGVFEVWNNLRGIKVVYNENQQKVVTVIDELQGSEVNESAIALTNVRKRMNRMLDEVTKNIKKELTETIESYECDMYCKMSEMYKMKAKLVKEVDARKVEEYENQIELLSEEVQEHMNIIGELKTEKNLVENAIIV